jgi:hypothetical protein
MIALLRFSQYGVVDYQLILQSIVQSTAAVRLRAGKATKEKKKLANQSMG